MGQTRSGERVGRELGKSAQLIERWSAKWDWVDRVAEWGDDQDRTNRIAQTVSVEPPDTEIIWQPDVYYFCPGVLKLGHKSAVSPRDDDAAR